MPTTMIEKVEELRKRSATVKLGGGADKLEKQRKSGKLTARERVDALIDPCSFDETGMFAEHRSVLFGMEGKSLPADGVITGAASIGGRLVHLASQDVGIPRITGLAIDPTQPESVWASIEVDGVRHSTDGGETWARVDPAKIPNPDGHAVVVSPGPPRTVFVVVNNDVYASQDDGATWRSVGAREKFAPYRHVRDLIVDPSDPCAAWATVGDYTPGDTGALMRTYDLGQSWQPVTMPVQPNSSMWVVRAQPDSRETVLAASRYGYLYRSQDGGQRWEKLRRELSEVASIVWVPS